MVYRLSISLIFAAGLVLASETTSAAPFEADLFSPGDALLTVDSSTGLEWLDLTATTNQSYNSIIAGAGGWTTTEGFRYATETEIGHLGREMGVGDFIVLETGVGYNSLVTNRALVELLLQFLGCTWACGTGSDYTSGIYGTVPETGLHAAWSATLNPDGVTASADGNMLVYDTQESLYLGSFLVRTTIIPEPSTALLMIVGLITLAVRRRN